MEMKVAIVENEPAYMKRTQEQVERWNKSNLCDVKTDTFLSSNDFFSSDYLEYHICFLDIQLDDADGLSIAKQLRARQYDGEIVFLTSFQEYVFDGYNVRALNYLMKPAPYERIKSCMDIIKEKLAGSFYTYRNKDEIMQIPYYDILYFNSHNHSVEIITCGQTYTQRDTLRNVIQYLPQQFVQCHRTVIINIMHVTKLIRKDVCLDSGHLLPISETYLESVRRSYAMHLCR